MGKINLQYAHHAISVMHMDESVQWYKSVFDADVMRDYFMEFVDCRIVLLQAGGAVFELFEYMGEGKKPVPEYRLESRRDLRTGGTKHICYTVNLPEFYRQKIVPLGIEIDHGPEALGNDWMMFIKDIDGVLFELVDIDGVIREPDAFDGVPCK